MILTRAVRIEPEDTLGSLYFGKIFPMGVAGLVEVAEQVVAGKRRRLVQDEPEAGYEGILRDAELRINWANHVDIIYNLIRGCRPAPGAWTTMDGKKLFVFNAAKRIARTFADVKGKKLARSWRSAASWRCMARAASSRSSACAGQRPEDCRVRGGIAAGTILG